MSIDNKKSLVLVLLDLPAAFDTVHHSFLLSRLSARFGICVLILDWFCLYLSDRTQYVRIQDVTSDVHALPCGVPQGSVLGPLLYSLYASRKVILQDLMICLITFMLMLLKLHRLEDLSTCKSAPEDCLKDIDL